MSVLFNTNIVVSCIVLLACVDFYCLEINIFLIILLLYASRLCSSSRSSLFLFTSDELVQVVHLLIIQIRALNSNGARDSKLYPHTRMQLSNYGALRLKIRLWLHIIRLTSLHIDFFSDSYSKIFEPFSNLYLVGNSVPEKK